MSIISLTNLTTVYILSTILLFIYTFTQTYMSSSNYFSSILIYMDTPLTNFIFYNLIFSLFILFYKLLIFTFFVQLKQNQTLKMVDKLKTKILDVFLFCYILEGQIEINSFISIVFIFFIYIVHEIVALRADYLINTPASLSLNLNYRLSILMLILLFVDYQILTHSYAMLYSQKSSYFIFIYYMIIMSTSIIYPIIKYFVDFYQKYTLNHINNKDQSMALINLIVQVPRLLIQIVLAIGLAVKFGIVFYLIFTVVELVAQLTNTIKSYNRIKKLTATMKNLKHITQQQINKHHDNTCMVCFQQMSQAILLPCKHFFHDDCLKQWIIKNSNHFCPKCKKGFDFQQKQGINNNIPEIANNLLLRQNNQQNRNNINNLNQQNNINERLKKDKDDQKKQRKKYMKKLMERIIKNQNKRKEKNKKQKKQKNYLNDKHNQDWIEQQQQQREKVEKPKMKRQLNEDDEYGVFLNQKKKYKYEEQSYLNKKKEQQEPTNKQRQKGKAKRKSNTRRTYQILPWQTPLQLVNQNSFYYLPLGSIPYGLPTEAVYHRTLQHMYIRENYSRCNQRLIKDMGLKNEKLMLVLNGGRKR